MPLDSAIVFNPGAWTAPLHKYAEVVDLTVQLYDLSRSLVCGPVHATPLFDIVASNGQPREFVECANKCLTQTDVLSSEIVLHASEGITVIGAPLRFDHRIVGAAIAGYALQRFPDRLSVERFSRKHQLSTERLWSVCRLIAPMHDRQLSIRGELLRVLGEGLLNEQAKSHESAFLYEESRRANRTKDEFLSVVSHELRTPLNAIVASIALGQIKTNDPVAVMRLLDTIARNVKAQVRIIDDLLDISRIVTGKLRIQVAPIDLASLIGESLDIIRPAADAKGISLQWEIDKSVNTVPGDRDRLQQVLWNLLSNAVKFTPANGSVRVSVRPVADSTAAIDVIDTGQGINPEFLPHVFERFTQADASRARLHAGLGLGLAISRHLVEMHGGTIRAESQGGGKGARFTIQLPLKHKAEAVSVAPESKPAQTLSDATRESGETNKRSRVDSRVLADLVIMVVEDEVDGRELLSQLLEIAGAQVVSAGSAFEALEIFERVHPDILVADIGLPDEDGYSLLRKVRALSPEQGGRVPAVALTGFTRGQDRELAELAGFQRHLAKPVHIEDLISTVKSLAQSR